MSKLFKYSSLRVTPVLLLSIVFIFCCVLSVESQFGHYGPVPYSYEQQNKTYYKLKTDPNQVKSDNITSENLFGWLNRKSFVKFYLWTRKNPELAHELRYNDVESIKSSNFDPKRLSKIIIHGWADGASKVQVGDWIIFMRDAYLQFADVNYIVVDYSVYASFHMFYTARPEVVAERVAEMISFLEKSGLELDPLHLVGWSWGAHVAGMAGLRLNGRIGRITGIDPAGPTFKFVSDDLRLDKSDAKFVDIIHVNGGNLSSWGFFGLNDPLGHVDFYPNGGGKQSGCPIGRSLIYETLWCSHGRGVKYFTESIFSPLAFPSCRCEAFDKYIRGGCSCTINDTAYMGEHLSRDSPHGIYMLVTRPKPLFGHGIQMNLSLPDVEGAKANGHENEEAAKNLITIQYRNTLKRLQFSNTFNSRNYPNDDILNFSIGFAVETETSSNDSIIIT